MKRRTLRTYFWVLFLAQIVFVIEGCSGGGEEGGPAPPANIAWIIVDSSNVAEANGGTSTASVRGSAFVSSSYVGHRCVGFCCLLCLYDNSYPGVDVSWENRTLGAGGIAGSRYGTLTDWEHFWFASIPVTTGSNTILIHARDRAGNLASTALTLQYSDVAPPTVIVASPPDGAYDIGTNSSFTVFFSEAMDSASISAATIFLNDSLNSPVIGTVGYSNQLATFTPSTNLQSSTQYTATVSTAVRDVAGNTLATPYTWTFTTAAAPDTTPPTVTSTSPTNGSTCVSTETRLSATFSETLLSSTVNASTFLLNDSSNNPVAGTVRLDGFAGEAEFVPNGMLADSSDYTATLTTGLADAAGNHLGADYTWAFTTQAAGAGAWSATTTNFAPAPRTEHTAVWTGTQMIVWGGQYGSTDLQDGARYDSATDSWTAISIAGAPSARHGHVAVWTGTKMIVWGGVGGNIQLTTGGIYDPATDSWNAMSSSGAPSGRGLATAVWTGSEMIVWGGYSTSIQDWVNTGARYNPTTNSWSPVSVFNAPLKRYGHTAIWTGSAMIIWGGGGTFNTSTGGIYAPGSDTWTATSTSGAPSPRTLHTAIWTGNEMIIWGPSNTGARYNPSTNSWQPTSTSCAPTGSFGGTIGVWSGTELIVWGGLTQKVGGRYDPSTDTWQATPVVGVPDARQWETGVWTGTGLIIWGGANPSGVSLNSGGIYRPQ